jgi:pimeloyl-ACP methyl ester carboxylesterase
MLTKAMTAMLLTCLGMSFFDHHSGASLATEIAASYPPSILTLCLIGTVIMTRAEQIEMNSTANVAFNEPVQDGSHLIKTWDYLGKSGLGGDLAYKQLELIDHIRAWHGKTQIYTCVFKQDMWGLFEKVKCPILVMCARDDVLWPYVHYIHEIVSLIILIHAGT